MDTLLALLLLGAVPADTPQRGLTFDTTLKSVAVFRDGFGFYVREGRVKLEDGWATTSFVPSAIRGTFWTYTTDRGDRIDTVITTRDNRIQFANVQELRAKLADKMGLRLTITTNNGQTFEGELARLLDDMLLLRVGAGFSAVPYDQIRSVQIPGFPIRVKVETTEPNKTTTLGVAYLQEGIRWEPSYVLNVERGRATLELRATMQNTTETLGKCDVLFVVGSPFVTNRGLTDLLATLPAPPQPAAESADAAKAAAPAATLRGGAPPPPGGTALSGEEAGELFFYTKKGLSLNTNDIAMVSIFQAPVPITPQFEWNADGEEVLYLLGIQNDTKQPLTTGPVFVVEDGKALGQETIKYTPAGAKAEVRLARGIGLRVERTEVEVRRSGSVQIGKSEFIPITLRGNLKVTNFRSAGAPLKITRTVRGRVLSQSDEGRVKFTQALSGEVNPINDLEWKITLQAGETREVTYTYETFVFADRAGTPPVPATPDDR